MSLHTEKDLSFETPSDWREERIVTFYGPDGANFVVAREPLRPGQTLRYRADEELVKFGTYLSEFDLLESRTTEIAGRPAIFLRFVWVSHLGPFEQTVTVVENERDGAPVLTMFTTGAPRDKAATLREAFERVLESVVFEAPQPAELRSAPLPKAAVDPLPPHVPIPGVAYSRRQ
jgi:hypothetical protein